MPEIDLLLLDVDGILTDGSILVTSNGDEMKRFHVRDGAGIVAWRNAGKQIGVITGRPSPITTIRLKELGVELIEQCGAMQKAEAYARLRERADVPDARVAYMGDDLADLPVLRRVGYAMTVPDAAIDVLKAARFVTERPGGRGAVREAIEHLLRGMNLWDGVLARYQL